MGAPEATTGLSSKAIVGIVIGAVVVVGAAGGIAFAATNGFGLLDQPGSSSEIAPTTDIVPGERAEDGVIEDVAAWSMDAVFDAGKFVECRYTYEGYDGTATMKSRNLFHIVEDAQGGTVHVIRDEQTSLVWVDGMTQALEFDTDEYESQPPGSYPTFIPAEFEAAMEVDPTTCVEVPSADNQLFELPAGMTSTPGTP